ncbi:MAG: radical SAM protein [Candidatus Omnitrophota bacterium]
MDITITDKCNNRCFFCPKKKFLKLICCESLEEIKREIKNIRKISPKIVLSGGEVTIFNQFWNVLSYCKKLEFDKIGVITNGRQFKNRSFLEKVMQAGVNEFAVSIYSLKPIIHEKITGIKGSCQETIQGINNLLSVVKIAPIILRINLVLNYYNHKEIVDTLTRLHALGIKNFIVAEQISINYNDHFLSLNKIKNAMRRLRNCSLGDASIVLRGFAPCLFRDCIKEVSSERIALKLNSPSIFWEKQNVDTFSKEERGKKSKYLSKFNNLFTKLSSCHMCAYDDSCSGLQKRYFGVRIIKPEKKA